MSPNINGDKVMIWMYSMGYLLPKKRLAIPTSPFFIYYIVNVFSVTVESLIKDTPNKGHCIKYLSTMDKT